MKRSRGYRRRSISSTTWTMLLLGLIIIALLILVTITIMNRPEMPVPDATEASLPSETIQPTPTRRPTISPRTPTPSEPEANSSSEVLSPSFIVSDCRFTLPRAANVTCGVVTVPANRDVSPGRTIRLAVAIFHSTSRSPAQDPLIYLHSNPGGNDSTASALQWASINYDNFVLPILEKRDMIVFDPRGTGLSVPNLDCQEAIKVYQRDQRTELTALQKRAAYSQALGTCRDQLASSGIDPSSYTTRANAADARDIIQALGLEQVNLYGVAYGARLAQTILRDYPEVVRSVVFDSPIPIEVHYYNEAAARYDQALQALFDACAASTTCSSAYPDLETVYETLTASLDESPLTITIPGNLTTPDFTKLVDGSTFSGALISAMNASFYTASLPKLVYDLSQGELGDSQVFLEAILSLPPLGTLDLSAGMRLSVDCHEQIFATTPEELMESQADYPRTQILGEDTILGDGETLFALCELWGAASFDLLDREPVKANVPALILAGQVDPITPASYGQQLSEALLGSYFVEVPGAGHTPSLDRRLTCPFDLAMAFLDKPDQTPNPACLDQVQIEYYTLYTGEPPIELLPIRIADMNLQSLVPEGWNNQGQGIFTREATYQDDTRLELRSSEEDTEDWLSALMANFDGIGFDRSPSKTNTRYANGIEWAIYRAYSNDRPVDLALAETDGRTLLVLVLSRPEERNAYYRTLFLATIDATTP